MFNKGVNPMQAMQMIRKAKKAIEIGSNNFEEKESIFEYQNGMIKIKTKGDLIKEIDLTNKEFKDMLVSDPEMASDLLSSSFNSLKISLNEAKTNEIILAAEKTNVSKHIIESIRNEDMLSMI